jgi:hypothetical protein
MKSPFFKTGRENFFQPLTGAWREVVAQTVVAMYDSVLGANRRGTHCVDRSDLRDIAVNALQDFPVMANEADDDPVLASLNDETKKANEIIRRLRQFGWIETFQDPGSHREVYRFTRVGKNAAQWMADQDSSALRMTQRNVRNTKYSLQAYERDGDAYDLFMALDHSRRITHDLADDIAEIYERRRAIVAEAIHEIALIDYVDYMESKFAPVTAVKLRADSVYRHQREISEVVRRIKEKPPEVTKKLEIDARVFRNQKVADGSVVLMTLDEIAMNLRDAMDTKMNELAAAVSEYTDRTTFLALQASVIASVSSQSALNRTLDAVQSLEGERQDQLLELIYARLVPFTVELIDESIARVRRTGARIPASAVQQQRKPTMEERREAHVRNALDSAFGVSVLQIRDKLDKHLTASPRGEVLLSELPVENYEELLTVSHALEAAAHQRDGGEESAINVKHLRVRRSNGYLEFDDFALRKGDGSDR